MPTSAATLLKRLAALKYEFGPGLGAAKLALLQQLETASLPSADAVLRLHELLCFWRAYPDTRRLLRQIETMLANFGERRDLQRRRAELADSGLAGTDLYYPFYMQMAQWLAQRWPDRLHIDWEECGEAERLDKVLHLLALYTETPGLDEFYDTVQGWIGRLKGPDETDAAFVVNRIRELQMEPAMREYFYEHLGLALKLAAGPDGPSRTRAKVRGAKVHFQTAPLKLARPDLLVELKRPPLAVEALDERRGQEIIDLAREAMVTRSRDLDVFAYGDPRDVQLIDCGEGLQFAAIGALPERRLIFEAVYGFLILKNGVPTGYVLNSALFGSVEVAYNVFETYRGGEAGHMYGHLLAALRQLFGADTFTIFPYQLGGDGNEEGLASGAWWFYQKLGFRARDKGVLRLMRRELKLMEQRPKHRSAIATLEELAEENVYFDLKQPRDDVIGMLPLKNVGLQVTAYLAGRFGAGRREAEAVCARDAMKLLGVRSRARWTAGEDLAWRRWSPLVLTLPGVAKWTAPERQALVAVVRAKGGPREAEFVRLFDGHHKLRRAIVKLAARPSPPIPALARRAAGC
jgi:hypothetical protein